MATVTRFVYEGDVINYTNSSGSTIAYKQIIPLTGMCVVAAAAMANGATGSVYTCGVFELAAKSTDVIAVGDVLFWDATNNYLTLTASGNTLFGIAAIAKAATVTSVQACLKPKISKRVANQADSTAATVADLKTDFNALLAKLIAAGVMNAS